MKRVIEYSNIGAGQKRTILRRMKKMVKIETRMSRQDIENQLKEQGFSLEFEDRDDQIWMDKDQKELLFISWINAVCYCYDRMQKIRLD